jgi:hypothetical protein
MASNPDAPDMAFMGRLIPQLQAELKERQERHAELKKDPGAEPLTIATHEVFIEALVNEINRRRRLGEP